MKVLFVTHHYLDGFGGGTFASRGYVNAIARLADAVTLMCPVRGESMPECIDPSVRIIPVEDRRGRMAKLAGLLSGKVHRYFDTFPDEVRQGSYDVVVFDTCYPSFRMIAYAREAGCKVVTVHHNYQVDFVRDNVSGLLRPLMLLWTRRSEREAGLGSDLNLVLTETDRELLEKHYAPRGQAVIRVLGVFEFAGRPAETPRPRSADPVFLITGDLGIRQTEVSLFSWAKRYYPILAERQPGARVVIAGKRPSKRLRSMCQTFGFELIPSPPDMSAVLARGRYYICPTELGGGLKLRIMDGLKAGLPVLTHAVSARGYEVFEGFCLFSYRDEDSFRHALDQLLSRPVDPISVQALYREVFSFDAGVERMRTIFIDR